MHLTRLMAEKLSDYTRADSLGSRLRRKRLIPLLQMIDKYAENGEQINIIDIGGVDTYWNILPETYLQDKNVKITIINLPGEVETRDEKHIRVIHGNACDLSQFADNSFNIAHSNSVLEHVGDWSNMVAFSREVKRVATSHFIQTPNYWFPIEPHAMTPIIHWLPEPLKIKIVQHYALGHWPKASNVDEAVRIIESARLLDISMFEELFSESEIKKEKFGLILTKSFIATKQQ